MRAGPTAAAVGARTEMRAAAGWYETNSTSPTATMRQQHNDEVQTSDVAVAPRRAVVLVVELIVDMYVASRAWANACIQELAWVVPWCRALAMQAEDDEGNDGAEGSIHS
ncbi:hypothetical protein Tco_0529271 [Tanacetum coccineum]